MTVEKGEQHFVAYNRADLLQYLRQRHQQHEHFRLQSLNFAGDVRAVNIAYAMTRVADDLGGDARPHAVVGKGNLDCETQGIVAWSMGST